MKSLERILLLNVAGADREVSIRIEDPVEHDQSWFAAWEIHWPGRKRSGSVGGVDSIQALLSALKIVGTEIYCSEEHKAGRLRWGSDYVGYGFPVPNGMREDLIGDDAKHL